MAYSANLCVNLRDRLCDVARTAYGDHSKHRDNSLEHQALLVASELH